MTKSEILTLNERLKTISNYLSNLSAGLLAGSAARVWVKETMDLAALAWAAMALVLISIAYAILYLLEPEE